MKEFEQLTVVVAATTERATLKETLRLIAGCCDPADIAEVILFVLSPECPAAAVAQTLAADSRFSFPLRLVYQQVPGLSGAVYEIPRYVRSSHFLIIGSDLEMDPLSIPRLIAVSKAHPQAIVCASKFMEGAKREGYGALHRLCNRFVNGALERLLHIKGTELLITFQIYPTEVFFAMGFDDPKRTFYQYTIRPLTRGVEYIEIPTDYVRRTEGASNFNLKRYVDLALRFLSAGFYERRLLKQNTKQTKQ